MLSNICNKNNTWKLLVAILSILLIWQYFTAQANATSPEKILNTTEVAKVQEPKVPEKIEMSKSLTTPITADEYKKTGYLEIFKTTDKINHSRNDLFCLARNVYYESKGEPTLGKYAVAQVTINRMKHPSFRNSICGVVYQPYQFSWVNQRNKNNIPSGKAWEESMRVARDVLNGARIKGMEKALFFHATYVSPNWRGMKRVSKIGAHVFYTKA